MARTCATIVGAGTLAFVAGVSKQFYFPGDLNKKVTLISASVATALTVGLALMHSSRDDSSNDNLSNDNSFDDTLQMDILPDNMTILKSTTTDAKSTIDSDFAEKKYEIDNDLSSDTTIYKDLAKLANHTKRKQAQKKRLATTIFASIVGVLCLNKLFIVGQNTLKNHI